MIRKIFRLTVLLIIMGCSKKEGVIDESLFTQIPIDYKSTVKLSELVDSVHFSALETDSNQLLGEVGKIIFKDGRYYILDSNISKSLFCFDEYGHIVFRITNIGQGEGEYLNPISFNVTDKGNTELFDLSNRSLLRYDKNGEYIDERLLGDSYLEDFISLGDSKRLVYSPRLGYENTLLVMDEDFSNTQQSYLPFHFTEDEGYMSKFTRYKNDVTFVRSLYGLFYKIDKLGNFTPRFRVDLGKWNAPLDWLNIRKTNENVEKIRAHFFSGQCAGLMTNLIENDIYFLFNFSTGQGEEEFEEWLVIIDKQQNQGIAIREVIDDINGSVFEFPKVAAGNEQLVSLIYPYEIIGMEENRMSRSENVDFNNMVDSLKYDDNPVLMSYRLKPDIIK